MIKIIATIALLATAAAGTAHGAYIYTFSFDAWDTLPFGVLQYESAELPAMGHGIELSYVGGNLNGCAPQSIEASFMTATEVAFGPGDDTAKECEGNPSGVVGFAFNVEGAFAPGTFMTSSAGRAIGNGNLVYFEYGGGSLTINAFPPGPISPVPEPQSIALVCGGLAGLFVARKRCPAIRREG